MSPGDVVDDLVAAMRAKDLNATMDRIAEDAIYFWSNGSAHFGKRAIATAMQVNFDSIAHDDYR